MWYEYHTDIVLFGLNHELTMGTLNNKMTRYLINQSYNIQIYKLNPDSFFMYMKWKKRKKNEGIINEHTEFWINKIGISGDEKWYHNFNGKVRKSTQVTQRMCRKISWKYEE